MVGSGVSVAEVRNVVPQNSQETTSALEAWAGRDAPQLGQLSGFMGLRAGGNRFSRRNAWDWRIAWKHDHLSRCLCGSKGWDQCLSGSRCIGQRQAEVKCDALFHIRFIAIQSKSQSHNSIGNIGQVPSVERAILDLVIALA